MPIPFRSSEDATRRSAPEQLDSWKEIAAYLRRDVTTVRRWEKNLGLPVHRLQREKLGAIYAFRGELDAWLESRTSKLVAEPREEPAAPVERNPVPPRGRLNSRSAALAFVFLAAALVVAWYIALRKDRFVEPEFRIVTTRSGEHMVTAAAISSDGERLAYAVEDGTVLVQVMSTGGTYWLPSPRDFRVDRLQWFPGGAALCVSGFAASSRRPAIWSVPVTGEAPQLLRPDAKECIPSFDGSKIAYTNPDRSEIWVMGADGSDARRVVSAAATDTFPVLLWSPDGGRLVYQRRFRAERETAATAVFAEEELGFLRSHESIDLSTGAHTAKADGCRMDSAAALPDGRLIFSRFEQGSPTNRLWEVGTDLRTGALLGRPRQITRRPVSARGVTATGDGNVIAVTASHSSQPEIFVAAIDPETHTLANGRRLTFNESEDYPHAWTADSSSIIFESSRNGRYNLFRQNLKQRDARAISASLRDEVLPQLAPGGKWILYGSRTPGTGSMELWRVPALGGPAAPVPIGGPLDEFRCPSAGAGGCVLRTTDEGQYIFFELDPVRGKGPELARTAWMPGLLGDWSLSADGRYAAIPNHDFRSARIRVLDLHPVRRSEHRERDVVIPGLAELRGIHWTTDGQGWFAAFNTPLGTTELHLVDLGGRTQLLREIPAFSWAVPSPNGKLLAYVDHAGMTNNAWIFDRN